MTVKEYDAMMEAAGTPKVWSVDIGKPYNGMIHSTLFLDENEADARAYYDAHSDAAYRKIYRTWDIWHFTEKHRKPHVFIVEYRHYDKYYDRWVTKVSQDGYTTLQAAQAFVESRANEPSKQTEFYYQTALLEEYYIHDVLIKEA